MKSHELKCYIIIVFLCILFFSLFYTLYALKQSSKHLKGNDVLIDTFSKKQIKENTNHDRLVNDFHQRKQITDLMIPQNDNICGVGWKYKNNSAVQGCARNFKWPNVVDNALQDSSINQCRDFFEFSCGKFNDDEYNKGRDSTFNYIHEMASRTMRDITIQIVSSIAPDQSKISAFHHACMEHNSNDNLRLSTTLQQLLAATEQGIKKYTDIPIVWGKLQLFDTILPVELTFELNPLDSTQLIPMIKQSGLFDDPESIESDDHLNDVTERLTLIYQPPLALEWAKQIVAIEKALRSVFYENKAANLVSYLESHNGRNDIIYNWTNYFIDFRFNITLFIESSTPSIHGKNPWFSLLRERPLWCYHNSYFDRLSDIIKRFSVSTWMVYTKHAILFHLDNGNDAPQIDPESHYAYHRQYDYRFSLPWKKPRQFLIRHFEAIENVTRFQTCVGLTEAYLPVVLDNYYVNSYLPNEVRLKASAIAENIKKVYVSTLRKTDAFSYLSQDDKRRFLEKINSVHLQVGIPHGWPIDRSELIVDPESYIESVLSIRRYHVEKNYRLFVQHASYNTPINEDTLFDGLVGNANAYYQHQLNTVTITAGFLQPPIFSTLFDKTSLYSRFGVMVAHELTHSIDNIGILFDTTGTYNPWISEEGKKLYKERLSCFIDSYTLTTSQGNFHDGVKTLNENIADNCAIKIAYDAFFEDIKSTTGHPPTIEQQKNFFVSYSQLYCESLSKNQEQFFISHRSHAINSLRVNNIVNQISDFDLIWGCNRYDRGLALKNKCSIF
jgi:predicted metalloendopeptidase